MRLGQKSKCCILEAVFAIFFCTAWVILPYGELHTDKTYHLYRDNLERGREEGLWRETEPLVEAAMSCTQKCEKAKLAKTKTATNKQR